MDENATTPAPAAPRASESAESEPERPAPLDPSTLVTEALAWVEENQTLAMLGAFALGVFIGALMRD